MDGIKIEANSNRYTFVWAKAVQKNLNELYARVDKELPEIALKYGLNPNVELQQAINFLSGIACMSRIAFVSGRGKHKTELQRDCERLNEYRERIEKYQESLGICGKSYSKIDTDATFMCMKEDYMRNGQLKPGYNVQIGVESEYIVGVGLFPNPTDTTTLPHFLKRVQSGCRHKYRNIIADVGYASEENYTHLEYLHINVYIKPTDYEVRKTKRFKNAPYRTENLFYDASNDCFICPNGKCLNYTHDSHSKTENGYTVTKQNYVCESCAGCSHREQCFKG